MYVPCIHMNANKKSPNILSKNQHLFHPKCHLPKLHNVDLCQESLPIRKVRRATDTPPKFNSSPLKKWCLEDYFPIGVW